MWLLKNILELFSKIHFHYRGGEEDKEGGDKMNLFLKICKQGVAIYGAIEYAKEEPLNALWFAKTLGEYGIECVFNSVEGAPVNRECFPLITTNGVQDAIVVKDIVRQKIEREKKSEKQNRS